MIAQNRDIPTSVFMRFLPANIIGFRVYGLGFRVLVVSEIGVPKLWS